MDNSAASSEVNVQALISEAESSKCSSCSDENPATVVCYHRECVKTQSMPYRFLCESCDMSTHEDAPYHARSSILHLVAGCQSFSTDDSTRRSKFHRRKVSDSVDMKKGVLTVILPNNIPKVIKMDHSTLRSALRAVCIQHQLELSIPVAIASNNEQIDLDNCVLAFHGQTVLLRDLSESPKSRRKSPEQEVRASTSRLALGFKWRKDSKTALRSTIGRTTSAGVPTNNEAHLTSEKVTRSSSEHADLSSLGKELQFDSPILTERRVSLDSNLDPSSSPKRNPSMSLPTTHHLPLLEPPDVAFNVVPPTPPHSRLNYAAAAANSTQSSSIKSRRKLIPQRSQTELDLPELRKFRSGSLGSRVREPKMRIEDYPSSPRKRRSQQESYTPGLSSSQNDLNAQASKVNVSKLLFSSLGRNWSPNFSFRRRSKCVDPIPNLSRKSVTENTRPKADRSPSPQPVSTHVQESSEHKDRIGLRRMSSSPKLHGRFGEQSAGIDKLESFTGLGMEGENELFVSATPSPHSSGSSVNQVDGEVAGDNTASNLVISEVSLSRSHGNLCEVATKTNSSTRSRPFSLADESLVPRSFTATRARGLLSPRRESYAQMQRSSSDNDLVMAALARKVDEADGRRHPGRASSPLYLQDMNDPFLTQARSSKKLQKLLGADDSSDKKLRASTEDDVPRKPTNLKDALKFLDVYGIRQDGFEKQEPKQKIGHWMPESWAVLTDNPKGLVKRQIDEQEAIWELLTTAVSHCERLSTLTNVFRESLLILQERYLLLTQVKLDSLYLNISVLQEIEEVFWNEKLAMVFTEASANKTLLQASAVADCFEGFGERYHPYIEFCGNQPRISKYLAVLKKEDPDFMMYLSWCEAHKSCNRLQLTDMLAAPFQRLTKYPLLLKAIMKKTSDEVAKEKLQAHLTILEKFLGNVNHHVTVCERRAHLEAIADRLDPNIVEVNPEYEQYVVAGLNLQNRMQKPDGADIGERELIHEEQFKLREFAGKYSPELKMDVTVLLFSDIILITKQKAGGRLQLVKAPYMIDTITLTRPQDKSTTVFFVQTHQVGMATCFLILQATTPKIISNFMKMVTETQFMYRSLVNKATTASRRAKVTGKGKSNFGRHLDRLRGTIRRPDSKPSLGSKSRSPELKVVDIPKRRRSSSLQPCGSDGEPGCRSPIEKELTLADKSDVSGSSEWSVTSESDAVKPQADNGDGTAERKASMPRISTDQLQDQFQCQLTVSCVDDDKDGFDPVDSGLVVTDEMVIVSREADDADEPDDAAESDDAEEPDDADSSSEESGVAEDSTPVAEEMFSNEPAFEAEECSSA